MQAIRSIYKVENGKLVIELPASFQHTEVEVIILPAAAEEDVATLPNAIDRGSKPERLEKLASMSVWDEADEQAIVESQNLINQWKVVEF